MTIKIGLIGDYSPAVTAHIAIPKALALAAQKAGCDVQETWLPTEDTSRNIDLLSGYDALWCVPASPYKSMEGALAAIKFAREENIPFLGTCGGFQHAVIEYARNALGFAEADHAESNPEAVMPIITLLVCSLVEADGIINLKKDSRIRDIYGKDKIAEQYHCSFGFNQDYLPLLEKSAMKITAADQNGDPRVIELANHPFFIATLFQPERSALRGEWHPLIGAYLDAAKSFQTHRQSFEKQDKQLAAET